MPEGSDQVWLAAIGPDVKIWGELANSGQIYQNQIATKALKLLGENPKRFDKKAGKPRKEIIK